MSVDIKALVDGQVIPLARNPDTGEYQEIFIAPETLHSAQYPVVLTAEDEIGNVSKKILTLDVRPQWIKPKTNWKSNDYINISDWRRIMGNLICIFEYAEKLYPLFPWFDMGPLKEYIDWPQAVEWNTVEENLESLKKNTYPLASGRVMTFQPGGSMIDYIELNRIESSIEKFYIGLKGQYENIKVLAFTLGGDEFDN